MNVGLVGPIDTSASGNPGWHMIVAGIRYLVRQARPDALFFPINMYQFDESWTAAEDMCDVAIICGNPRFSMSEGSSFWEHEIWHRLHAMHLHGVRVIDGWAGSAFPFTHPELQPSEMATALMYAPKRQEYLSIAKLFHGCITRDPTMQCIYQRAKIDAVMLPCSSWWAKDEYGVQPQARAYDVVVPYRMDGHPEVEVALASMRADGCLLRVIATTVQDYAWLRKGDRPVELVADPASLLRVFAGARRVLSFRLHSAIPAASLGCAVATISIDSRTDACRSFQLPVTGFPDLAQPVFAQAVVPDTALVVDILKTMLD